MVDEDLVLIDFDPTPSWSHHTICCYHLTCLIQGHVCILLVLGNQIDRM